MTLTHALLRLPGDNFAQGLTQAGEGAPDPERAVLQHQRYCEALADCGLSLTILPADPRHPDGCFVEDTAVVTDRGAILTRPGAPSRRGEVDLIEAALKGLFPSIPRIAAPGTVDAGDVCEADGHFLIGLSARTNEAGAHALADHLDALGYRSDIVDIRQAAEVAAPQDRHHLPRRGPPARDPRPAARQRRSPRTKSSRSRTRSATPRMHCA